MAGGILVLASNRSEENVYINEAKKNRLVTFFKTVHRRHVNFATEPIEQFFKNVPDFGSRVTCNIFKKGDLLGETYVIVDLPSIPKAIRKDISETEDVKQMSWVKKLGYVLIKNVDLEISGLPIEHYNGEWLNIWYELSTKYTRDKALDKMIGNIKDLTDYSTSKGTYKLQIPLAFWFCQLAGLYLPIVAMKNNDIKIHIEFNNFSQCYKETPTHYIKIEDNFAYLTRMKL